MPVTDDEVAALRAFLSGDLDLYHQIRRGLDHSAATRASDSAPVAAAFFEAVDRRFGDSGTAADVISYVADVRARSGEVAEQVDPQAAERLIRAVMTDETIADIDTETKGRVFIVFLGALISDEQLDDDGLDAFLAQARKTADGFLSQ